MPFCGHCIEEGRELAPIRMPHTGKVVRVCAECRERLWADLAGQGHTSDADTNDGMRDGNRIVRRGPSGSA